MSNEARTLPDGRIFRTLFESAPDAILLVDRGGRIVLANDRAEHLFGFGLEELIGSGIEMLVPSGERGQHAERRWAYAEHPRSRSMGQGLDLYARCKDGSRVPVDIMLSPIEAESGTLTAAVVRDVTEHRRAQERLRHLAEHDALTGCLNRAGFERVLALQVARSRRYDGGALLMVDLDDLKTVNDTHGHQAGDEFLRHVGEGVRRRLRSSDVVGRLGGDEFGVILPHASVVEAEVVAEQLVAEIWQRPLAVDQSWIPITVSVGVAPLDGPGGSADAALAAADAAMYEAKRAGRGRVGVTLRPIATNPG